MINTIIDTSVILDGKSNIEQLSKDSNLFVTDIILQELDGNKNSDGSVGYNARDFFRTLSRDKGEDCTTIPSTNKPLQYSDTLRKMYFGLIPLYIFVRKNYKTKNINDSKIIEIAKDYDLKLITNDVAQRVRALSEGVNADMFEKSIEKKYTNCIDTNLEYESAIEKSLKLEKEGNKKTIFKSNQEYVGAFFAIIILAILLGVIFGAKFVIVVAVLVFVYFLFIVPVETQKEPSKPKKHGKIDTESSEYKFEDTFSDPMYSNMPGNAFHHE